MKKNIRLFLTIFVLCFSIFFFSSCNKTEGENLIEDTFYMMQNNVLQPSTYFTFEKIDDVMHWSDSDGESGTCYSYTNNSAKFGIIQEVDADKTYRFHVTITATVEKSGRMEMILHIEERNVDLTPYYLCNSKYRPDNLYYYIIYYDTLNQKIVKQDEFNEIRYYPELKDSNMYFAGWYFSSLYANKAEVGSKIKDTLILYSKWEELNDDNSVTVSFETNGGSKVKPIKAPKNGLIKSIDCTKDNADFVGWFVDEELTKGFVSTYEEDMVLYAKWRKNCRVRYIDIDGTVLQEESIKQDEITSYNGKKLDYYLAENGDLYRFLGWDKDVSRVTDDVDINAKYELLVNDGNGLYFSLSDTKDYYILYTNDSTAEEIIIPDTINELPVKEIKSNALRNSTAKKITIPNSVERIEKGAINGCLALEYLTIPFVGDKRRDETSLYNYPIGYMFGDDEYENSIMVEYQCFESGSVYNRYNGYFPSNLKEIRVTDAAYILGGSFANCPVEKVVIEKCDYLGYEAFSGCTLKEFELPDDLGGMGDKVFAYCPNLENVELSIKIEKLPNHAFRRCLNLKTVKLNDGLKEIGEYAFYDCENLEKVICNTYLVTIGFSAFGNCYALKEITFGNHLRFIQNYAFQNCGSLETIELPASLQKIGSYAFSCTGLKEIGLPDNVTIIGEYAFSSCKKLTKISLPSNLYQLGRGCFNGSDSLKRLTLPNNYTFYDWWTFSGSYIEILEIPDDTETISGEFIRIFYNIKTLIVSSKLVSISFPDGYRFTKIYTKSSEKLEDLLLKSLEDRKISVYYLTPNGESEARSGNWWYYDTEGNPVELIIE